MEQKIDAITKNEESWIATQLENASRLVEKYSPSDAGQPLTLAALDRAYAAWVDSGPSDGNQINAIINAVGLAFWPIPDRSSWIPVGDCYGSVRFRFGNLCASRNGDVLVYPLLSPLLFLI